MYLNINLLIFFGAIAAFIISVYQHDHSEAMAWVGIGMLSVTNIMKKVDKKRKKKSQ